ncbi:MAG: hypothetical protein S4CHLAM37_03390 [Chlamydiia bacterium]|nr:hypothetical protein [Chlamydiia bacterium]
MSQIDPSSRRPNLDVHQVSSSSKPAKSEEKKSVRLPFYDPTGKGTSLSGRVSQSASTRAAAPARSLFAMNRLKGRVSGNPGTVVSINKQFSQNVSSLEGGRTLKHAETLEESARAANIRRRMAG